MSDGWLVLLVVYLKCIYTVCTLKKDGYTISVSSKFPAFLRIHWEIDFFYRRLSWFKKDLKVKISFKIMFLAEFILVFLIGSLYIYMDWTRTPWEAFWINSYILKVAVCCYIIIVMPRHNTFIRLIIKKELNKK